MTRIPDSSIASGASSAEIARPAPAQGEGAFAACLGLCQVSADGEPPDSKEDQAAVEEEGPPTDSAIASTMAWLGAPRAERPSVGTRELDVRDVIVSQPGSTEIVATSTDARPTGEAQGEAPEGAVEMEVRSAALSHDAAAVDAITSGATPAPSHHANPPLLVSAAPPLPRADAPLTMSSAAGPQTDASVAATSVAGQEPEAVPPTVAVATTFATAQEPDAAQRPAVAALAAPTGAGSAVEPANLGLGRTRLVRAEQAPTVGTLADREAPPSPPGATPPVMPAFDESRDVVPAVVPVVALAATASMLDSSTAPLPPAATPPAVPPEPLPPVISTAALRRLGEALGRAAAQGAPTHLEIDLEPADLGRVHLDILVEGAELRVRGWTAQADAARALSQGLPELQAALQGQHMRLVDFSVMWRGVAAPPNVPLRRRERPGVAAANPLANSQGARRRGRVDVIA